jgi:hypothetical protein
MAEEDEIIASIKAGFEPWSAWDINEILDGSGGVGGGLGFGFRTRDVRVGGTAEQERARLEAWYDSLEHYRIEDVEANCAVNGDIATIWGFYTEDFKHKGQDSERVRVRYSMVQQRQNGRWQFVWNHRDIQDFTNEGFYVSQPI